MKECIQAVHSKHFRLAISQDGLISWRSGQEDWHIENKTQPINSPSTHRTLEHRGKETLTNWKTDAFSPFTSLADNPGAITPTNTQTQGQRTRMCTHTHGERDWNHKGPWETSHTCKSMWKVLPLPSGGINKQIQRPKKKQKTGMALITAKSHKEARECVCRHALLPEKQSSLSNLFSFITAIVIRNNWIAEWGVRRRALPVSETLSFSSYQREPQS